MADGTYGGDITPAATWEALAEDENAVLVDVRTPTEWSYVGLPDLGSIGKQPVLVPWVLFPSMQLNEAFASELASAGVKPEHSVYFLCRSGVRSRAAAIAMTALGYPRCYNIADGFEGDPDGARHRGTVSGWKVSGLPWVQQ